MFLIYLLVDLCVALFVLFLFVLKEKLSISSFQNDFSGMSFYLLFAPLTCLFIRRSPSTVIETEDFIGSRRSVKSKYIPRVDVKSDPFSGSLNGQCTAYYQVFLKE